MAIVEPTTWQSAIMGIPEMMNLAVFGGRGAGRTTGALFVGMRHCEIHAEQAHVLFIRQTLRSLREVEDNFQMMLASAYGGGVRVNRQEHLFRLPSGATVEFAPINDTEDMAKLQGRSFSLIIADEYGNFSPQQMRFVDQLRANLRAGQTPTRFILLANPGGRGHSSIKNRFVDKLTPGKADVIDKNPAGYAGQEWILVPATFKLNPHNPTNYESNLAGAAHGDKELLRAWMDGAWNIARGAMFADVIDEQFQRVPFAALPFGPGKRIEHVHGFVAGDWGQSAPAVAFACWKLLVPVGRFPRGSLIIADEVSSADPDDWAVGRNWSLGRFAEAIDGMVERTGVHKEGCLDDAKGLQPDDTLIGGMGEYGYAFERPRKNRRSGWAIVREMLTNSLQRNGKPGLWVSDRCPGWWATVPVLPRDPLHIEDVDTRSVDHWADATRYGTQWEPAVVSYNSAHDTTERYGTAAPMAPRLA